MGVNGPMERLSGIIARCESDGRSIRRVEAEPFDRETWDELQITIDVSVSLCTTEGTSDNISPRTVSIQDDGGLQVSVAPSVLPEMSQYLPEDVSANRESARIGEDGSVLMTYTLTMGAGSETLATSTADIQQSESQSIQETSSDPDTADSADCESSATNDAETDTQSHNHRAAALAHEEETCSRKEIQRKLKAARSEDLPPYEDTEYLQCLYESFDTFAKMGEELKMDVASETVRRYMIDAGVHEPSTYNTETDVEDQSADEEETNSDGSSGADFDPTDDDTESDSTRDGTVEAEDPIDTVSNKQIVADGIGLPDDLTIEELADAIQSSMTLYDVQRQLDLSRDRAQELLKQLNLIDFVMQRVADNPEKQVSREKIAERIRSSTTGS